MLPHPPRDLAFLAAFGLVDLSGGHPELGFVSMRAIADYEGELRSHVEFDPAFKPDQPVSRYALEAYRLGRIPKTSD